MSVQLIAGLGNPGPRYAGTRHNIGWQVVEAFGKRHSASWKEDSKFKARLAKVVIGGQNLWLAEPLTYMNDSGQALGPLLRYFKLETPQLCIIYDEINLPPTQIKFSVRGSAGGHNGVASVLQHCGQGFVRFRIGIGTKPHKEADLKNWVLSKFSKDEQAAFDSEMERYCDALDSLLTHGTDSTMNQFNTKPSQNERNTDRDQKLPGDLHPRHTGVAGGHGETLRADSGEP